MLCIIYVVSISQLFNCYLKPVSFSCLGNKRKKIQFENLSKCSLARFTRQFFWHGTCLNLAPVPKILSPAPCKSCKWKNSWHECPKTYGGLDYLSTWSRHSSVLGHSCHEFFHLHDKNEGCRAANFRHRGLI